MAPDAAFHARRTVRILLVAYCVFAGLALAALLRHVSDHNRMLAAQMGRSFFRSVVATRSWNAQHGGVYVPVTERFQPNPYLQDPLRDLETTAGLVLTKVNPAYMTRLIGERFQEEAGVHIHITSRRPIRPGNEPDAWERASLAAFEGGVTELFEVLGDGSERTFRYMAPLVTKQPCLSCHARQGYRVGEIRGGISVSFDYGPFAAAVRAQAVGLSLGLLAVFSVGFLLVWFFGGRLVLSVDQLQGILSRVRSLEGLLPICSYCKKIRREGAPPSDPAGWAHVEEYISEKTDALFSHSLCPECLTRHYPESAKRKKVDAGAPRPG